MTPEAELELLTLEQERRRRAKERGSEPDKVAPGGLSSLITGKQPEQPGLMDRAGNWIAEKTGIGVPGTVGDYATGGPLWRDVEANIRRPIADAGRWALGKGADAVLGIAGFDPEAPLPGGHLPGKEQVKPFVEEAINPVNYIPFAGGPIPAALKSAGAYSLTSPDVTPAVVGLGITGAASGVMGAARAGAPALADALEASSPTVSRWLHEFARQRALKAAGFAKSDLSKLPEGRAERVGDDLLSEGVVRAGRSPVQTRQYLEEMRRRAGGQIDEVLTEADAATGGSGEAIRQQVAQRQRQADIDAQMAAASREGNVALEAQQLRDKATAIRRSGEDATQSAMMAMTSEAQLAQAEIRQSISRIEDAMAEGFQPKARHMIDQIAEGVLKLPPKEREAAIADMAERLVATRRPPPGAPPPMPRDPMEAAAREMAPLAPKELEAAARARAEQAFAARNPPNGRITPPASAGLGFDLRNAIQRIRSAVGPELNVPGFSGPRAELQKLLDEYGQFAEAGVSYSEAARFKSKLQDLINNWADVPASKQVKASVQNILKQEIDDQLTAKVGQHITEKYQKARGLYGSAESALDANANTIDKIRGNRFFSPSDQGLGGLVGGSTFIATGDASALAAGVATAGANKLLRERLPSTLAAGSESMSRAVASGAPKAVDYLQQIREALATNPQALGRWAAPLARAASAGDQQLAVAHYLLSQKEPDYREMFADR